MHRRHRLGDRPTRTSPTARWHSAAPRSSFEGVPTYPDAGRFWKMIQDHKVTVFYTAPTAIRSLIKAAESNEAVHPRRYDLSSLRILGSVGEPINPAAWGVVPPAHRWRSLARSSTPSGRPITGGHMITLAAPARRPLVPGSCTLPFPGIMAAIVDETGKGRSQRPGRHPGRQEAVAPA